jgi:hypothetical protein
MFRLIRGHHQVYLHIYPLLGNARNTHAANNTGAVFSVIRAATVAVQRAMHTANKSGAVFSVLRGPCRDYVRETV